MAVPNKIALLAFRATQGRKMLYYQTAESEGVRVSEWLRRLADARVAELQRQQDSTGALVAAGRDPDQRGDPVTAVRRLIASPSERT